MEEEDNEGKERKRQKMVDIPSSILSSDWQMMLLFSCSTLPLSGAGRLSSAPCRLSRRLRFSPLSASSPAITCCVLHRISSADNIAPTLKNSPRRRKPPVANQMRGSRAQSANRGKGLGINT
ncbi:hypothetical protein INR49_022550 [Caranx melampygus]|nr:hypothetical protein INR49_022550 [Caranx melampygus]